MPKNTVIHRKSEKFMKEYTNITTTPLKFHKFFWRIWLPVQVILGSVNFATTVAEMSTFDKFHMIDIGYYTLSVFLFGAAFGGFFRWKKSALVAVFAQMALNLVYVMVLYVLFSNRMPDSMSLAKANVAGTVIRCVIVGVYYFNRRKLFVKGGYTDQQLAAMRQTATANSFAGSFVNQQEPQTTTEANFCVHCGKPLANSPNFCIYCGGRLK